MTAMVVHDDMLPPPAPISVRQAIDELQVTVNQIRHRLRTLTDWYVFPNVVPSSIKAYDPRLRILKSRLRSLAILDYKKMTYIMDDSDGTAVQYLVQIIDQLQHSVRGIENIFINHYDRDLANRRPFHMIWETLLYRSDQVKQIPMQSPSNPDRRLPEDLRPAELGNFCPGALGISNRRDRGRISFVEKKELSEENRKRLKAFQGAYINWQCPDCAFKVRYHVTNSTTSNIHSTDEIREHPDLLVQYRSSFLAKCHLYIPQTDRPTSSSSSSNRRRESFSHPRYGCVFCFAKGYELIRGETAFSTIRAFAEHLAYEHRDPLPPSLLIHRYAVAVDGKTVVGNRWDVNFL
jgi:hypothetical protein